MEVLEIIFKSDTEIRYRCGCARSRLEPPEYWEEICEEHKTPKGDY